MNLPIRPRLLATAACAAILGACAYAQPAPATAADGVLVGANGMTLYTFDRDAGGKSMCNGPCAANWPPLLAPAGASAAGEWSVVTRDDGSRQWAYKGKPVYYWAKDAKPGDRTGDGVNNVWHLARP
ncbi:hypothetical protein [Ramlibacter sp.]|uniref:COG4315 family predicted lipoprotein n=1 Tax=Ramlibacter sp. TaxID=1917967 RepID=UPI002B5ED25C|nr:hypothetical protein [Ramlibacter sp.]HWI83177.1 hypothetical protein [Ramlibacter sp.]